MRETKRVDTIDPNWAVRPWRVRGAGSLRVGWSGAVVRATAGARATSPSVTQTTPPAGTADAWVAVAALDPSHSPARVEMPDPGSQNRVPGGMRRVHSKKACARSRSGRGSSSPGSFRSSSGSFRSSSGSFRSSPGSFRSSPGSYRSPPGSWRSSPPGSRSSPESSR